jgi:hypothetical protein
MKYEKSLDRLRADVARLDVLYETADSDEIEFAAQDARSRALKELEDTERELLAAMVQPKGKALHK